MNTSIPIDQARVVAAMTPVKSKAPFNRGHLIVQGSEGIILQVQAYTRNDEAQGPELTAEQLQALVSTGHAIALPSAASLVAGAALWVLRPNFPRRDAALASLSTAGVLVQSHQLGPHDAWLCLVDEGAESAESLRDRWSTEAARDAKRRANEADWEAAERLAELAHSTSRSLDAERLALLAWVYDQVGRSVRAEGILRMAEASRGADFAAEVRSLMNQCGDEPVRSVGGIRHLAGLRAALRGVPAGDSYLDKRMSARLVHEAA